MRSNLATLVRLFTVGLCVGPSVSLALDPPLRIPLYDAQCYLPAHFARDKLAAQTLIHKIERNLEMLRVSALVAQKALGWSADLESRMHACLESAGPTATQLEQWRANWSKSQALLTRQARPPKDSLTPLVDLHKTVCEAATRTGDVLFYWQQREVITRLQEERHRLTMALNRPPAALPDETTRIAEMDARVSAGQFDEAIRLSFLLTDAQHTFYNSVRGTTDYQYPLSEHVPMTARSEVCPSQPPPTLSADGRPKIRSSPNPDSYILPQYARALPPSKTKVRIRIDARGCATHAMVYASSDIPAIDETAVRVFLDSQYLPASVNGVAVPSEMVMVLRVGPR